MTLKLTTLVLIAALAMNSANPQIPASDRMLIENYRNAIRSVDAGLSPGGLEAAFLRLASVREVLMRVSPNRETLLESLSDEEFGRLSRDLPGAILNREEIVFVRPDPAYFGKLAAERGNAGDRAFFSALQSTYPDSVWPVYIQQQTDYSGCTRFGSSKLVETYRVWSDFQRQFPGSYVAAARTEIEDVAARLVESNCACGDLAAVETELQLFLAVFQTSPLNARVDQRLQALRSRRSDIRVNCISG